ncbi:MAG TPA: sigma-70 family RNA polymerase sigma factor [Casimicrobiaceae bacterium]
MPPVTTVPSRPSANGATADADAGLVARIAQGDLGAFESLFRRYRPRLQRYVGLRTRRPDLVEEIVNDTMLVVWRRARSFDVRARVSTWIIGIALRTGLKATGRTRQHAQGEMVEPVVDETPEHAALRAERQRRLRAAMAGLSPQHRAVLELAYFEGLSCRDAARRLGCPVDTVKTRMFHARRHLKTLLPDLREDAA